jgi:hypothetical protein
VRVPGWQCTVKWSIALILVLGAVGCQTATPHPSSPPHDESFTGLWETYRHCQASEDPMEMKADVFRLDETVQTMHEDTSSALIPDGIERLVDERPSRLAVDPRAMAASCALLAGYQARAAGQPQLAAEMFAHIVSHYPVERYRYYVVQAYYGLKQIEGGERFLPKQPLPFAPEPES